MKLFSMMVLAAGLAFGSMAYAQDEGAAAGAKKPLTAQQQRMKDCNADAKVKALKGDERKAFMKECLSGSDGPNEPEAPSKAEGKGASAQQEKMKACNGQAKERALKGEERKAFMKECLSA